MENKMKIEVELPDDVSIEDLKALAGGNLIYEDNHKIKVKVLRVELSDSEKPKRKPRNIKELQDFVQSKNYFPDSEKEIIAYVRKIRG